MKLGDADRNEELGEGGGRTSEWRWTGKEEGKWSGKIA